MKKVILLLAAAVSAQAQLTTIQSTDLISNSRATINNNFTYLDSLIAGKQATITVGTSGQFYSWDKTMRSIAIADVTGLQNAIDGKAALSHVHVVADISDFAAAMATKAAASHGHIIADVTDLQTTIDGKADASTLSTHTADAAAHGATAAATPSTIVLRDGGGGIAVTSIQVGDGTAPGCPRMLEITANGSNYRGWCVPDLLSTSLEFTLPNAVPNAGDIQYFGAPSNGKSAVTFGAPPAPMVWPGAGVPNYVSGTSWGASYTVGTAADNLVQLNASGQLPAVSAALLTNFPTFNQTTTGSAAGITGKTFLGTATQIPQFTGTPDGSKCVHTDANGNLTEAAADCGSGGGGTDVLDASVLDDFDDFLSNRSDTQGQVGKWGWMGNAIGAGSAAFVKVAGHPGVYEFNPANNSDTTANSIHLDYATGIGALGMNIIAEAVPYEIRFLFRMMRSAEVRYWGGIGTHDYGIGLLFDSTVQNTPYFRSSEGESIVTPAASGLSTPNGTIWYELSIRSMPTPAANQVRLRARETGGTWGADKSFCTPVGTCDAELKYLSATRSGDFFFYAINKGIAASSNKLQIDRVSVHISGLTRP